MNKIEIWGNIGNEPEISFSKTGMAIAKLSIADNKGKDKNGNDKGTQWLNCTFFDGLAESVGDQIKKGAYVHISGRLDIEKSKKENDNRFFYNVLVKEIAFPVRAAKKDGQGFKEMGQPVNDEDIPF